MSVELSAKNSKSNIIIWICNIFLFIPSNIYVNIHRLNLYF